MRRSAFVLVLASIALAGAAPAAAAKPVLNGFELESETIDVAEIVAGGPPRDGIPALEGPPHAPAARAPWPDETTVIGVSWNGESRAYPVPVLDWHELVNDTLGGRPLLVSFCPLCGTGMVFDRRVGGEERHFGVSGLLYRSDMLVYDRESESLWSQIAAQAVSGPAQGQRLELVRSRMMSLAQWRALHPETTVLTRETGHRRDYARAPYGDYATSTRLFFAVRYDRRYHPKTPTLGLRVPGGAARAYPGGELVRAGGAVEETFAGYPVRVAYDPESQVFDVRAPAGVEVVEGYWFAWSAFHPGTTVFTFGDGGEPPAPSENVGASGSQLPGDGF